MSQTTLYRKHRPQSFDDVKGQDQVVNVLKKAVENQTFSHAYLFAGSRGTGKTSVARIFARAIGCSDNDIYEVDAASNRKIEHIRELRESVSSLPLESPFKLYIIDEVHMLTREAFNAFLKTLEEPPAHALFVLATTEAQKLPETVSSRCQVFDFKTPTKNVLKEVLLDIAKKESRELESSAAELMALLADGSFRDSLGILQKIITVYPSGSISQDMVEKVTSAPPSDLVNRFLEAIVKKDRDQGLSVITQAVEKNINIEVFLRLVLEKIRFVIFLRSAPSLKTLVEDSTSPDDLVFLQKLSDERSITPKELLKLLNTAPSIRLSAIPQLPLEVAILELTEGGVASE